MVNFTTLHPGCVDDACILNPEDFELLDRPSTVAYSRRHTGFASGLEQSIASGSFAEVTAVPAATLQKIIEGARRTAELSNADKQLLPPVDG